MRATTSARTAIGVDVGGTNLRAARVSTSGEILEHLSEPVAGDPARAAARIEALCRALDDASVAGIGIGIPGRVDACRRTALSGGYIDFSGVALAERIEGALGRPVALDNDCNMALVAEMARGAARGLATVVMFTIGTGIGGAVAIAGEIARGRGTAGQLGHIAVSRPGLPCVCGRRGCVETTSSGTALKRSIAEAGLPLGTRAEDLFAAEEAGDDAARRVLDGWASTLRDAIDSMVAALDPEVVLLGGGLGAAARRALLRAPARSPWYQCDVVTARLGDDAGAIGAALTVLAAPVPAAGFDLDRAHAGVGTVE